MPPQPDPSIVELVTRYALRSKADKLTYDLGTRLAEQGAVRIHTLTSDHARVTVNEGVACTVDLRVEGRDITAVCSVGCSLRVCRHAVAAAHALWLAVAGSSGTPEPRAP